MVTSLPEYPDHYLFKPSEAARILHTSLDTLRYWRKTKRITATPLGHRTLRYRADELRKILEGKQ